MKTYLKLAVFLSLLHTAAYSQFSDFRLDQYKLPDIKTSKLDFMMNFHQSSTNRSGSPQYLNKSGNSAGSFSMDFNHRRNTENYQGNTGVLISGDFHKYHYETPGSSIHSDNYENLGFAVNSENRFFKNKNFLEVSPRISLSQLGNQESDQPNQTTQNTFKGKRLSSESKLTIAAGHGRIEPIQDLRLAIYILEELNKAGRLKKTPPDETVIKMARVISKIKRERFFDSRLRKINELQVIDSFMLANDLLTINDINYFSILNDEWDYAAGPVRSAGLAISGGVDNYFSFIREKDERKDDYNEPANTKNYQNILNTEVFARLQYYKPLNLHWQMSAVFRSSYGYIKVVNPLYQLNVSGNTSSGIFKAAADYAIQYLPNSRTSVSLSLQGVLSDSKGRSTVDGEFSSQYKLEDATIDLNSALEAYYYISPRLRAWMTWNYDFGRRKIVTENVDKNRLSEQYLSFSISYSLF